MQVKSGLKVNHVQFQTVRVITMSVKFSALCGATHKAEEATLKADARSSAIADRRLRENSIDYE